MGHAGKCHTEGCGHYGPHHHRWAELVGIGWGLVERFVSWVESRDCDVGVELLGGCSWNCLLNGCG